MANTNNNALDIPAGSILESDSPEPTILKVVCIDKADYKKQEWKNGLGRTEEIGIYPPEKDFWRQSFFWRLSQHVIDGDCNFSVFPDYECTTIVLPNGSDKKSTVMDAPVTNLQFMVRKGVGKAQFHVEKIGQPISNESGETGKKLLLGSFALVYVVEGYAKITLDESHMNLQRTVIAGQTLYIERDEEASPTSILIQACDPSGKVAGQAAAAAATAAAAAMAKSGHTLEDEGTDSASESAPSQRRGLPRRKSSLVVYGDQPLYKNRGKPIPAAAEPQPEVPEVELAKDLQVNERDLFDEGTRRDSLVGLSGSVDAGQILPSMAFGYDTDMPPPVVRDRLDVDDFPPNTISTAWIKMMKQGMSEWIRLPAIVCRGTADGPVVEIDVKKLYGTVVAIPCVNVIGYLQYKREFADGRDLNRLFPGKEDGFVSQVYCYQLMNKVISQFNYLIDLHTASFGRINSYYVRADMNDSGSALLAHLQMPQIILHNSGQDGTLRSAASARGVKAITVEIGNPQLFQRRYVLWSFVGVMRILKHLDMFTDFQEPKDEGQRGPPNSYLCSRGFWIYTKTGGVLEVYPAVTATLKKGELIARIKNIFGNVIDEYFAPCSGVVIGRSSNPVAMSGDRILHLGVMKRKGETLPKEAKENY
ncbi:hypothetical protein BCR43DRAFT_439824 [Syncephalastrum racemosum]|uniref:Succinylglutamate desuccinylase/Aspartoacylase catalytic domain-containing protein n=1 Tax=Syncephalastrum racemosum TaxID=13706 RepID=A0A1X2HD64_SYNRA|nr:hypothetical protein BCR43DRAFT_439824 [Syncephalastrum racemosum]